MKTSASWLFACGVALEFYGRDNPREELAFHFIHRAAKLGHPSAQRRLGAWWMIHPRHCNMTIAGVWLKKAAQQNHPSGQFVYGQWWELNSPSNHVKALFWFRKAAQNGYCRAFVRLGRIFAHGEMDTPKDYKKAVACFKIAQTPEALCDLAKCYQNGLGVEKDAKKALSLYKQVQQKYKSIDIRFDIASCYDALRKYKQSIPLLRQLAQKGNAKAQTNLGYYYFYGIGVSRDKKMAQQWYEKAAAQGCATAMSNLGLNYKSAQDFKQAIKWLLRAAELGDATGQYEVGCFYAKKNNPKEAFMWYQQATEQGHKEATKCVARCYFDGNGIRQDLQKALEYFTKIQCEPEMTLVKRDLQQWQKTIELDVPRATILRQYKLNERLPYILFPVYTIIGDYLFSQSAPTFQQIQSFRPLQGRSCNFCLEGWLKTCGNEDTFAIFKCDCCLQYTYIPS